LYQSNKQHDWHFELPTSLHSTTNQLLVKQTPDLQQKFSKVHLS